MKKIVALGIGLLMVAGLLPNALWAWCWIRDTDVEECGTSGTYVESCCNGNLIKWTGLPPGMTYRISFSTASGLRSYIRNAMNRWNVVAMSTFTFTEGGLTTRINYAYDGVNLVNIDSNFCTHNPGVCGMGILGFSGTWTSGSGAAIEA